MKKIYSIVTALIMLFINSMCVMDYAYNIDLLNKANHPIGYFIPNMAQYQYPDTILPRTGELITYDTRNEHTSGLEHHFSTWEKYFSLLPQDTLSIYIFHTDTLDKYPWEVICDEYKILKRYDLSLKDLEHLKFKVPYPPSPAMSNMKMFPPYREK